MYVRTSRQGRIRPCDADPVTPAQAGVQTPFEAIRISVCAAMTTIAAVQSRARAHNPLPENVDKHDSDPKAGFALQIPVSRRYYTVGVVWIGNPVRERNRIWATWHYHQLRRVAGECCLRLRYFYDRTVRALDSRASAVYSEQWCDRYKGIA